MSLKNTFKTIDVPNKTYLSLDNKELINANNDLILFLDKKNIFQILLNLKMIIKIIRKIAQLLK